MNNFFLVQKYFNENVPGWVPTSPEERETPRKSNIDAMLERFPKSEAEKLRALNLSEDQLKARLTAIVKLDLYINDATRFSRGNAEESFGSRLKHMASLDDTRTTIQVQMKAIRPMLLESYEKNNNGDGWDKIINTPLNYIDNDGSANLETIKTRMSQRMFLQKIIGPTTTAVILQDNTELPKLNPTQIQQKSRLQQFLLVLEQKEQSGEIGSKIRHTNDLLSKNKIEEAITYARWFINGEYEGVTVELVIGTDAGLSGVLRAMGNTKAAGEVMVKSGQTNLETTNTSQAEALQKELTNALEDTNRNRQNAERVFQETINHLDPRDPNRAILENNKEDAIESLRQTATIVEVTDNYIKQHGDEGLPVILQEYNDMKGLYGAFNFTDENAKLTRDIAIMIASFIITAGASAILTGIAGGARAIAIGRSMAAAKHFQNGNRIRGALNVGASVTAQGAALGFKGGAAVLDAANKAKLGFAADAVVFTSADAAIRWIWSQEGEASTDFWSFLKDVTHNAVMFGAFHGMGKLVDKYVIAWWLWNIHPETAIGKIALEGGKTVSLAAGDIGVMQALYAAENGELSWSWEAVFVALAFRGGSKVAEFFPKLTARWKGLPKEKQENLINEVAAKESTSAEIAMERLKWLQENDTWRARKNTNTSEGISEGQVRFAQNKYQFTASPESKWESRKVIKPTENSSTVVSKEFGANFWVTRNYKIELHSDGSHKVLVHSNGKWVEATPENWIPKWQMREHFDARIANELKALQKSLPSNHTLWNLKNTISAEVDITANNAIPLKKPWLQESPKINQSTQKTFNANEWTLEKSHHSMENASEGSTMRINVVDTNGNRGVIEYIKEPGNRWQRKNIEGNFNTEKLNEQPLFQRKTTQDGKVQNAELAYGEWTLQVESVTISPKNTTQAKWGERSGNPQERVPEDTSRTSEGVEGKNERQIKEAAEAELDKAVPGFSQKFKNFFMNKFPSREALKNFRDELIDFLKKNWGLVSGVTGWTVMRNFLETHKTNPLVTIPTDIPKTPEEMTQICAECLNTPLSTINYERPSTANGKLILTENRRNRISERWIRTTEWKNAVEKWNELLKTHENHINAEVRDIIQKAIDNPTVANVQKLQQCIGMEAKDGATGQDGILGKRTTAKFVEFIEQISNKNIEQSSEWNPSDDSNIGKIEEVSESDQSSDSNSIPKSENSGTPTAEVPNLEDVTSQTAGEPATPNQ